MLWIQSTAILNSLTSKNKRNQEGPVSDEVPEPASHLRLGGCLPAVLSSTFGRSSLHFCCKTLRTFGTVYCRTTTVKFRWRVACGVCCLLCLSVCTRNLTCVCKSCFKGSGRSVAWCCTFPQPKRCRTPGQRGVTKYI